MRRLHVENVALERRVRECSAELEASNAERDAFTRYVPHDLGTPLNAVLGFASLLTAKFGS